MTIKYVVILCIICACRQTDIMGQDDILYWTKLAARNEATEEATFTSWRDIIRNKRHTFFLGHRTFDRPFLHGSGLLAIDKQPGTFDVNAVITVDEKVAWETKAGFPIESDLKLMAELYPSLVETTDNAPSKQLVLVKMATAWSSLRFDAVDARLELSAAGEIQLNELEPRDFLAEYEQLGYVEIDSEPDDASITVRGHSGWKKTSDNGYLPEGTVTIELTKDGFETLTASEDVMRKGINSFRYKLTSKK